MRWWDYLCLLAALSGWAFCWRPRVERWRIARRLATPDRTPWPCIMIRTDHDPHTWYPSPDIAAHCKGVNPRSTP